MRLLLAKIQKIDKNEALAVDRPFLLAKGKKEK
jgi:hypothetical protein